MTWQDILAALLIIGTLVLILWRRRVRERQLKDGD